MDGAWYMFLHDKIGKVVNDTWHRSFEEALDQGEVIYGVERSAWRELPAEADVMRIDERN